MILLSPTSFPGEPLVSGGVVHSGAYFWKDIDAYQRLVGGVTFQVKAQHIKRGAIDEKKYFKYLVLLTTRHLCYLWFILILNCKLFRFYGTLCILTAYYLDSWDLCFNAGPTKSLVTMIAKTAEHLQVHTTFINRKSQVKLSNTKHKAQNYLFKCFGILLI